MDITGSRQRACLGGWLIATLFLVGLNAYRWMSLEQQPLVGYSPTIKMLRDQLQHFDNTLTSGAFSISRRMGTLTLSAPSNAAGNPKGGPPNSADRPGPQKQASVATTVPALSGIVRTVGPHGTVSLQAVLNGRVCRKGDRIDNFTVDHISTSGVVVRRSGRKWQIKSPEPYYSSDQGE